MKKLITASALLAALLLAAPAASAWVIHNQTGHELGVSGKWSFGFDKFKIRPGASHRGGTDAPLLNVSVSYLDNGELHQSYNFSIPAEGSARVSPGKVKVYDAANKLIYTGNMDSYAWR